ncbi:hypothetical protein FH972_022257 [Carpinus fangiana]|uniref:Zona occludens toxin N-terminal domain-containing protein n=1 Tax=Carpinus fangiana TaxID=176857 RepID=A0A5N6KSC5_9ROSI|nr:hypothetical protein FH972_022257 [Carpinus fangiana]
MTTSSAAFVKAPPFPVMSFQNMAIRDSPADSSSGATAGTSKSSVSSAPVGSGESLNMYLNALGLTEADSRPTQGAFEEIRTTPLFSWQVKKRAARSLHPSPATFTRGAPGPQSMVNFGQYALLGQELESATRYGLPDTAKPIFLNTDAPWSAFLCGSQGSGKSYTLSCILEGCMLPHPSIGKLPQPLAGILFHYDPHNSNHPCEAAYLSSHIPVTVLVSPSNYWERLHVYKQVPGGGIKVRPMMLQDKHLNVQRMRRLMAFRESDGSVPLYMEVIVRILRDMAVESKGGRGLGYADFLRRLDREEDFTKMQKGPMNLRLNLLDSFMSTRYAAKKSFGLSKDAMSENLFATTPGTLTIVDLSDPFIDPGSACSLFDMCLALFLEHDTKLGRVVALDEAHKFMTTTDASNDFTESLLQLIREQRHKGARIVISTQEPTISPRLLDLCSMTLVHRFTSPAWLNALRSHLAGASDFANDNPGAQKRSKQDLMDEIVNLRVGESLLFSPSAMLDVVEGAASQGLAANGGMGTAQNSRFAGLNTAGKEVEVNVDAQYHSLRGDVIVSSKAFPGVMHDREPGYGAIAKLGMQHIKFRTRPRLTADGGRSILASTGVGR